MTKTFNFVTRDSWIVGREETDEDIAIEVERLISEVEAQEDVEDDATATKDGRRDEGPSASDEAVFAQSYIPRTLEQVYDPERDVARVLRGEGKGLIYADITGVASIHKTATDTREGEQSLPPAVPAVSAASITKEADEDEDGSGSEDEDGESGSDDSDEDDGRERQPKGKKFEDKDDKKVCLSFSLPSSIPR